MAAMQAVNYYQLVNFDLVPFTEMVLRFIYIY